MSYCDLGDKEEGDRLGETGESRIGGANLKCSNFKERKNLKKD